MPARFSSSPGIPVTKSQMLVHWNLHLLFLTGRTRCIRNAPALMHGLYSIRFSQLAHQTSDFLVIRSITYKQTLIKTGRKGRFINQVPLSSCFYEYLFRDFCDGRKEKCSDWMRQQKKGELREPCIKAGAFRKAFVLDVRRKGMGVPLDEHSLASLHPFKSLR